MPYRAIATGLKGQWLLLQNNRIDGIQLLKRALEELHAQHHEMLNMDFTCDLATALVDLGKHEQALILTVNAIEQQQRAGKFLHMPALFRAKGIILASRSAEDYPEAEKSLRSSIEWARRQSATLFELKSAIDLAELLLSQKRMAEAYRHISAALDQTSDEIVPRSTFALDKSFAGSNPAHGPSARAAPDQRFVFSAITYKSAQSSASRLPRRGACCDTNSHSRVACHEQEGCGYHR